MDDETKYFIIAWVWDGLDYQQKTIYETTSIKEAEEKYDSISPTPDRPLIELYETGEDDDRRIKYKEI